MVRDNAADQPVAEGGVALTTRIRIVGAGITGLWQALTLARAGFDVSLNDISEAPFANAASRFAGAMLAPFCEAEAAEAIVSEQGLRSIALWNNHYAETRNNGSLVVAAARDLAELSRFARATTGHRWLDAAEIAALEPALEGRFGRALFYPGEAHVEPRRAMSALLEAARAAGCRTLFGKEHGAPPAPPGEGEWLIDCRGIAAAADLPGLRGVRGEMLVIETEEVALGRPVRFLHPRIPFYIVPWRDGRFMIGATVIESGEGGAVSVRSALELLGVAYALHPAFGEAKIIELGAGVRPAFADNLPRIIRRGRIIHVNGLYRHGFLLAPVLAQTVLRVVAGDDVTSEEAAEAPFLSTSASP
jgi:glycine oxidase